MNGKSFKDSFLNYCIKNNFEQNDKQVEIVNLLNTFINPKKKLVNLFLEPKEKLCFYLFGGVGLGKTMIFNYFYDYINIPKQRSHFNEFMIEFHDFRHQNKENSITKFVKKLKTKKLIYLDEFQVTNIVDAMILGQLFEKIFSENIKIIITSNIQIDNLYKDGLQREQFLPFISVLKNNSIQKELIIDEDYRKLGHHKLQRVLFPINEKTKFKLNQIFRQLTKNKKKQERLLIVKGREFKITNFYEGLTKFDFKTLCDDNLGAEDYINLAALCKFIVIENIPIFNNDNANQQQRFITLIDILYEKKVSLIVSMETSLEDIGSSDKLTSPFQRTVSRLFELTASN